MAEEYEVRKCEGSGHWQMLDWFPDEGGKPFPGACVCIHCSYGVQVVRGTVSKGVSKSGHKGLAGKLRVHYVKEQLEDSDQRGNDFVAMSYRKKDLIGH